MALQEVVVLFRVSIGIEVVKQGDVAPRTEEVLMREGATVENDGRHDSSLSVLSRFQNQNKGYEPCGKCLKGWNGAL